MGIMEEKRLKEGGVRGVISGDEERGMYGGFGLKEGRVEGEMVVKVD